jgi:hypothetical protein
VKRMTVVRKGVWNILIRAIIKKRSLLEIIYPIPI